jgi:hypothetical protein
MILDFKASHNDIGGVMVSVLGSGVVDREYKPMRLFSAISWRYKVLFDELIMMPALNQTNTLSCILIEPVH